MLNVGLDLGSTAIKMVLVEDGRILARRRTATAPGQEKVAERLIEESLAELGLKRSQLGRVTSTGYGKKLYSAAAFNVDEITANASGLFKLSEGRVRTIVNIGGQDLKLIVLDEAGRVRDFKMNDKCAAGTGRFFELAARILDVPLDEFSALGQEADEEIELNSTCVVFAESEIVSLLARGVSAANVIGALYASVARRVAGLLGRQGAAGPIYLDGGPARHRGLAQALEDELMEEVQVLPEPQFTVAYGAATI